MPSKPYADNNKNKVYVEGNVKKVSLHMIQLNVYKTPLLTDNNSVIKSTKESLYMKATGIDRRIDE